MATIRINRLADGRRAAGVTLLELLIVVVILAALLALALPFALRSLDTRELEATEDNITSELLRARVKAQESGRAVEVVVEGAPPRLVMRYFDCSDDGLGYPMVPEQRPAAKRVAHVDPVRDAWWEESSLDPSVRVTSLPTVDGAAREATSRSTKNDMPVDHDPLRVAVYMPDGSILFSASLLLMHQNGLRSRVSVDPWTGQPAVSRAQAARPKDAAESPNPDDDFGEFGSRPDDATPHEER